MDSESSQELSSSSESSLVAFKDDNSAKRKKEIRLQKLKQKNRKIYASFKNKLKEVLPGVFQKDTERGDFIFNTICDFIRLNNLIDTLDDMRCVQFVITQRRIVSALNNFFSIGVVSSSKNLTARFLENYVNPYKSQFNEISLIGSGGFGEVFKAQHILDGVDYAVKKIRIKARRENEIIKCLEEVKILAQINHKNIVSYKQAWIELLNKHNSSESSWNTSESDDSEYLSRIENDFEFFHIINDEQNKACEPMEYIDDEDLIEDSIDANEPVIVLYIQMSLCERNLREWMDNRIVNSSLSDVDKIATQILSGLDFIHDQKLIHHDIKPQNIFVTIVSGDINVQIGDFGLACCRSEELENGEHSYEIGTPLYTAPEQRNKICNQKSDVYSFGIILFELMNLMQSDSERIEKVRELRAGIFPLSHLMLYQGWVEIMETTIQEDFNSRPSAKELLQKLKNKNDLKFRRMEQHLKALIAENARLLRQLREKDEELSLVRVQLLQLSNWESYMDDMFPVSDDSF